MAIIRRPGNATFKRPPAPNWHRGMAAALQALYAAEPLPPDQAAQIECECAAVPYRAERQPGLALKLPGDPS